MLTSTKQLIKDISAAFIAANSANKSNDAENELRHLLYATSDIAMLLQQHGDGWISYDCATSYAESLESTATRIKEISRNIGE